MPIESHAKILVVEDDATVRNLVLTALEAQSFDLLAESTGRGAIASAATNAPDVVLLDLGLPDIDGHRGRSRYTRVVPDADHRGVRPKRRRR